MNRRGVALMAVIWLLALLSVLAAAALLEGRTFVRAAANRLALQAAHWAATSCVSWARSQPAWSRPYRVDSIAVSGRQWCTVESAPAGLAINVNLASAQMVRAYLGNESLANALLDWRDADNSTRPLGAERNWYQAAGRVGPRNGPLAAVEELSLIRGWERIPGMELRTRFTVTGEGTVSVRYAPVDLLAAIEAFPLEALRLDELRPGMDGRSIASLEELAARLPAARRQSIERDWAQVVSQFDFGSERRIIRIVGLLRGDPVEHVLVGEALIVNGMLHFHSLQRR